MRVFLGAILLLSSICYAIGLDSTTYVGLYSSGKKIEMKYFADGKDEKWTGGEAVYRARHNSEMSYCWEHNRYYYCSSAKNKKPEISYVRIEEDRKEYKEAAKIVNFKDGFMDLFICETGCTIKMPKYVYTYADDGI